MRKSKVVTFFLSAVLIGFSQFVEAELAPSENHILTKTDKSKKENSPGIWGNIWNLFKKPVEQPKEQPVYNLTAPELKKKLSNGVISLNKLDEEQVVDEMNKLGFEVLDTKNKVAGFDFARSVDEEGKAHKKKLGSANLNEILRLFCERDYIDNLGSDEINKFYLEADKHCVVIVSSNAIAWAVNLNSYLNADRKMPESIDDQLKKKLPIINRNEIKSETSHYLAKDEDFKVFKSLLQNNSNSDNSNELDEGVSELIKRITKQKTIGQLIEKSKPLESRDLLKMLHFLRDNDLIVSDVSMMSFYQLKLLKGSYVSRVEDPVVDEAVELFFQGGATFKNSSEAYKLAKGESKNMDQYYKFLNSVLETVANTSYFTEEIIQQINELENESKDETMKGFF